MLALGARLKSRLPIPSAGEKPSTDVAIPNHHGKPQARVLEPKAKALEVDTCRTEVVYPNVLPSYFADEFLANIWRAEEQGQHLDVVIRAKSAPAHLYQKAQQGRLTLPQRALVERLFPPSFLMTTESVLWKGTEIHPVTFCEKERDSLALKLAAGGQANRIAIGDELTKNNWMDHVRAAFNDSNERWIFQEYTEHPNAKISTPMAVAVSI